MNLITQERISWAVEYLYPHFLLFFLENYNGDSSKFGDSAIHVHTYSHVHAKFSES